MSKKPRTSVKKSPPSSKDKGDIPQFLEAQCTICIEKIKADKIATLDNCSHTFCMECIREWSAITNKCPLCQTSFSRIEYGPGIVDSRKSSKISVLNVDNVDKRKETQSSQFYYESYDESEDDSEGEDEEEDEEPPDIEGDGVCTYLLYQICLLFNALTSYIQRCIRILDRIILILCLLLLSILTNDIEVCYFLRIY